jgi:hypothetical protein
MQNSYEKFLEKEPLEPYTFLGELIGIDRGNRNNLLTRWNAYVENESGEISWEPDSGKGRKRKFARWAEGMSPSKAQSIIQYADEKSLGKVLSMITPITNSLRYTEKVKQVLGME